jgi:hypothetical protein
VGTFVDVVVIDARGGEGVEAVFEAVVVIEGRFLRLSRLRLGLALALGLGREKDWSEWMDGVVRLVDGWGTAVVKEERLEEEVEFSCLSELFVKDRNIETSKH